LYNLITITLMSKITGYTMAYAVSWAASRH